MAINVIVQYNGWFLPDITVGFSSTLYVDPRLLPSGNPFKYHVVAFSLQPMKRYIITTMFDNVRHCFCFVFIFCLVPLHGD